MKIYITIIFSLLSFFSFGQKKPITRVANPVCDSAQFSYTAKSSMDGTSITVQYSWSRAAVAGIANTTASGTGATIAEVLDNTTALPVTVKYAVTMQANGCGHTDTLSVLVYPTPMLSSNLAPPAICDSTSFNYTATSFTPGTTYSWVRPAVTGIANPSASGVGAVISEVLVNNTPNTIAVQYLITLSANGCTKTQTVTVLVYPTPILVKNYSSENLPMKGVLHAVVTAGMVSFLPLFQQNQKSTI